MDFEIEPMATLCYFMLLLLLQAVFRNSLRFDQDILWGKCSKFDFTKLS
jgi:hypothetical protein